MEDDKVVDNLLQELKRGILVLSVLLCVDEASYGYSLVNMLKTKDVDIEQNTLYPLLRRLEKQGLLESLWDTEESRPRKYYKISNRGIEVRERLKSEWNKNNKVIENLIIEGGKL